MATMKKIWKYLLNFLVLYLLVSLLIWLCLKVMDSRKTSNIEENNTALTEKV